MIYDHSPWLPTQPLPKLEYKSSEAREEKVRKESCFFFSSVTGERTSPGNDTINDGWGPRLVLNEMYHCELHSGSRGLSGPI